MKSAHINLWPNSHRGTKVKDCVADLAGDNVRAKLRENGVVELETSTFSRTDARVFGHGQLQVLSKKSGNSPDVRGTLRDPEEFAGHVPTEYQVSGWWKTIKSGRNAGERYLSLVLTPVSNASTADAA